MKGSIIVGIVEIKKCFHFLPADFLSREIWFCGASDGRRGRTEWPESAGLDLGPSWYHWEMIMLTQEMIAFQRPKTGSQGPGY
jgi:hypothetical protein